MPSLHRHGTDRKGVWIFQQVFCNAKRADVYPSALLADAMKPLNVLSKFENHFAIRTVCFQVQLEVDGYFSAQRISCLQPPQAGRVGTASQFLNSILQIRLQKHLLGFAQTQYSAQESTFTSGKRFRVLRFQCNTCFLRTGKRTARGTCPQWLFQAQPYSAQGSAYYAELRCHSMQKCRA